MLREGRAVLEALPADGTLVLRSGGGATVRRVASVCETQDTYSISKPKARGHEVNCALF